MPTHKYEIPDRGRPIHLDPKIDLEPHIKQAADELEAAHARVAADAAAVDAEKKTAADKVVADAAAAQAELNRIEAEKAAAAAGKKVPAAAETKPEIQDAHPIPVPAGAVPRPSSPPKGEV